MYACVLVAKGHGPCVGGKWCEAALSVQVERRGSDYFVLMDDGKPRFAKSVIRAVHIHADRMLGRLSTIGIAKLVQVCGGDSRVAEVS